MQESQGNKANKLQKAGDSAHAMSPAFNRKVDDALSIIEDAIELGTVGISFSTGKDSLVTLDLVRQVCPTAPAAFYDSGEETEFDENYKLLELYNVDRIETEMSLAELCRRYGYWGHEADEEDADVEFGEFMVGEPSDRFIEKYQLSVVAMGLRAEENAGRKWSFYKRGKLYQVEHAFDWPIYHLCPIQDWTVEDVWAYIVSRELQYNPIYDKMTEIDIPRKEQRISMLLGSAFANHGRYAHLRQIAPDKYHELNRQFPKIGRLT